MINIKILMYCFLLTCCYSNAQEKETFKDLLEGDSFGGDRHLSFEDYKSVLSPEAKKKLRCYNSYARQNNFITKGIVFIVHRHKKDIKHINIYLDAKKNILNYLYELDRKNINIYHSFYFGGEAKSFKSGIWRYELQIKFQYTDELGEIQEAIYSFDSCNSSQMVRE